MLAGFLQAPFLSPRRRLIHSAKLHSSRCRYYNPIRLRVHGSSSPPPSSGEDEEGPGAERKAELNLLLRLIVGYPAARGTIAVTLGYLGHCEPLGSLKWDAQDALVGLVLALPVMLLDTGILLPSWAPERTLKKMKLLVPREVAKRLEARRKLAESPAGLATSTNQEGAGAPMHPPPIETPRVVDSPNSSASLGGKEGEKDNSDLVEVEREVSVAQEQHPLRQALHSVQLERVTMNPGQALSPPSEALLLTLVHISEEMLYRGVILCAVVRWVTENLYYAGVDESVTVVGGLQLAPPQLGAVIGASLMTTAAVGLLVQRHLFPLRLINAIEDRVEKKIKDGGSANRSHTQRTPPSAAGTASNNEMPSKPEKKERDHPQSKVERVSAALERVRQGVARQQRWIVAIEGTFELAQWSTLSTGFLLTGNILTPIVASIASDAVYSICQRHAFRRVQEGLQLQAEASRVRMQETTALLSAVQEHRKARLQAKAGRTMSPDRQRDDDDAEGSVDDNEG